MLFDVRKKQGRLLTSYQATEAQFAYWIFSSRFSLGMFVPIHQLVWQLSCQTLVHNSRRLASMVAPTGSGIHPHPFWAWHSVINSILVSSRDKPCVSLAGGRPKQ